MGELVCPANIGAWRTSMRNQQHADPNEIDAAAVLWPWPLQAAQARGARAS
jgi:hypothetical protein